MLPMTSVPSAMCSCARSCSATVPSALLSVRRRCWTASTRDFSRRACLGGPPGLVGRTSDGAGHRGQSMTARAGDAAARRRRPRRTRAARPPRSRRGPTIVSTSSNWLPSATPAPISTLFQAAEPSVVRATNSPRCMCAIPAGTEMTERRPGTQRRTSTSHTPWRRNRASTRSRSAAVTRLTRCVARIAVRPPRRAIPYRISAPATDPAVAASSAGSSTSSPRSDLPARERQDDLRRDRRDEVLGQHDGEDPT